MKIVLIGAGNVGQHLGLKLHEVGQEVVQVYSRKKYKANKLAKKINANYTTSLSRIATTADLYILAVHDDAIDEVAKELIKNGLSEKLIVHTSGATPSAVLNDAGFKRFGVFYPLQTFSSNREPDFNQIPICIDAEGEEDYLFLNKLANKISTKVQRISDEQRAVLHVAAVFANNFSNHLFHIAADILKENELSFDLLLPLINETVEKLKIGKPNEMQTGPAKRGDEETINRHLKLLGNNPDYAQLYKLLSEGVSNASGE